MTNKSPSVSHRPEATAFCCCRAKGPYIEVPRAQTFSFQLRHFLDPGYVFADLCVHTGGILPTTAVTPGSDPQNDPASVWPLTHEWPSAVTLAAVHPFIFREIPGTNHAVSELLPITDLTVFPWEKRHHPLQQGSRIGLPWNRTDQPDQFTYRQQQRPRAMVLHTKPDACTFNVKTAAQK